MATTFSARRQEVVTEKPLVSTIKERWPAIFTEYIQISVGNLSTHFSSLASVTKNTSTEGGQNRREHSRGEEGSTDGKWKFRSRSDEKLFFFIKP